MTFLKDRFGSMFTHAAEGEINFKFNVVSKNLCPEHFVKLGLLSPNQPDLTSYLCPRCFSTEDWKLCFMLVSKAAHPLLYQVIVALTT